MSIREEQIERAYRSAQECYFEAGTDTEQALRQLDAIPVSIQCWQGDDVRGFETPQAQLTGGIQTSGNYPGRARNGRELREDLGLAMQLIPGTKRVNLHAIYLETDQPISRDRIMPEHFVNWVAWAQEKNLGLDFNPTCFSHPLSDQGMTLSHPDQSVRSFWIDHCIACSKISEAFGVQLGSPAVMNIWIPDGMKDEPADRLRPRQRLQESLDRILAQVSGTNHKIAVEGKLFGIGAESYTVGSNDFYLAYATSRKTLLCLDAGHFHPTENVADKISTALCFVPELLLHVSRPVRWDSDHVVLLDDATLAIAREVIRCGAAQRIHVGFDYFDASVNRIAAWVVGARNMKKALLSALLEPQGVLAAAEESFDFTARLVQSEEMKSLPWQAVWDYYCLSRESGIDSTWYQHVKEHERTIMLHR